MTVGTAGDPRLQEMFGLGDPADSGALPIVRRPRTGPSGWMIAACALIAALFLFWILESRRTAPPNPSDLASSSQSVAVGPELPPLYIPPTVLPQTELFPVAVRPSPPVPFVQQPAIRPQVIVRSEPAWAPQTVPTPLPPPPPAPRGDTGPTLVIDAGTAGGAAAGGPQGAGSRPGTTTLQDGAAAGGRIRSSALANRTMTVPRGTLIPAVLETAFDSTKPGFARAIVSRDVRGFDGKKVLIPRGSHLVGEYQADVSPGQKRALISWSRLVRPDGATIAINSPTVDTLGRGGVRAHVNTHLFERFTDALLQSTVELGRTFATRRATGSVLVLPGSSQGGASIAESSDRFAPTLKLPAATSISIFVARDLEFADGADR